MKNVNKRKNRLAPVKLGSKKQDKKVLASWEGSGGEPPSSDREVPRPTYHVPFLQVCEFNKYLFTIIKEIQRIGFNTEIKSFESRGFVP